MNVGLLGLFLNGASHEGEKRTLEGKKLLEALNLVIWLKFHPESQSSRKYRHLISSPSSVLSFPSELLQYPM